MAGLSYGIKSIFNGVVLIIAVGHNYHYEHLGNFSNRAHGRDWHDVAIAPKRVLCAKW